MVDESKKQKKTTIDEEDVSNLLQSYSVETVLALLQEVAQVPEDKIDWNAMVKNTATGISNAKEYQLLWRHLAYGQDLIDQLDDDENPMDDDSDLEYEREASPAVSREASAEAAACVKVLMASGQNSLHLPSSSTIDAPLTINIPNSKAHTTSNGSPITCASQGTNVSIPVTVQKQPLSSGTCSEKRPNASTKINFPPRKRRRGWSSEDDAKLTSAVKKFGERNWASIARGDFKNDRKASELSQRWATLRKKQGNSNAGTSSQLSETQLAAAHRAMSLALDMPMGDTLKMAGQCNTIGTKPQLQSLKASASRPEQQCGTTAMAVKPSVPTKGPPSNPITSADSMVKAAAVAAGARIASATDASSLLEAARSQNVVHIKTGTGSAIKSSSTSITNQLPSNVHFIRNGLAKAPISSPAAALPFVSRPAEASKIQDNSTKPAVPAVQPNPIMSAEVSNTATSIPSIELAKTTEDVAVVTSASETKDPIQKDGGCNRDDIPVYDHSSQPEDKVVKHLSSFSGNISKENASGDQNNISLSVRTPDNQDPLPCSEVVEGETNTDNLSANKEIPVNPKSNVKDDDLQSNPTAPTGSTGENKPL